MTEQLMETTVRAALWQQFGAAIDMLENALLACPETRLSEHLWIDAQSADDGTFWDITFHTLGLSRAVSYRLLRRSPPGVQEEV